jgi:hypothetical protein
VGGGLVNPGGNVSRFANPGGSWSRLARPGGNSPGARPPPPAPGAPTPMPIPIPLPFALGEGAALTFTVNIPRTKTVAPRTITLLNFLSMITPDLIYVTHFRLNKNSQAEVSVLDLQRIIDKPTTTYHIIYQRIAVV